MRNRDGWMAAVAVVVALLVLGLVAPIRAAAPVGALSCRWRNVNTATTGDVVCTADGGYCLLALDNQGSGRNCFESDWAGQVSCCHLVTSTTTTTTAAPTTTTTTSTTTTTT